MNDRSIGMAYIAQAFGLDTFGAYRSPTKMEPIISSVLTLQNGLEMEHSDNGQLSIRRGMQGVTLFFFENRLIFKLGFAPVAGVTVKTAEDIASLWPQDYLPDIRKIFIGAAT